MSARQWQLTPSFITSTLARQAKRLGAPMLMAMSASTVLPAQAATLIYNTDYLEYSLPEAVSEACLSKDNCPEVHIQYLATNHAWMNTIVNDLVNELATDGRDLSAPASESVKSKPKSAAAVKTSLDEFTQSQMADLPADSMLHYSIDVQPEYLGHVGDFELFEVSSYLYLGGAHGMPYVEYVVLDSQNKRRLDLDDLLIAAAKPKFEALAYDAYKNWVKDFTNDVAEYEKNWPFSMTDNVSLNDQGVVLKYQSYAIAPYASGQPELVIPYNKLAGVLRPQYLSAHR